MSESDFMPFWFGIGLFVACATGLVLIWIERQNLANHPLPVDDAINGMGICIIAGLAWPLMLLVGSFAGCAWTLSKGVPFLARRLVLIDELRQTKRRRKALEAKAQSQVFEEVERLLRESNQDDVQAFMAQLNRI